MKLASLRAADLKVIAGLLSQREKLVAELARIDQQLAKFEDRPATSAAVSAAPKAAKAARSKRQPRGAVREAIINMLKRGGDTGVTVKAIATELGVSSNRIYTWFYSTGSRIKEIKKSGPARYAWRG